MSISDKTRKYYGVDQEIDVPYASKLELIIDETEKDDSSIVGEECHILSGQKNGPRHGQNRPKDEMDTYDSLIRLCRIHYKMIDDQIETFTVSFQFFLATTFKKDVVSRVSNTRA
ncbi:MULTISPECIES: hypothetical protein [unclassified Paenibacillus]|uniref:hypothetical protein n=1 Tax=Paenibacillus TaxID=44249 RepID=UPI00043162A7|nr:MULTISPECIES: hypothetical protein [unclassified Paenibacillus]CDN44299.1 hypothetical protein BN871_EO_00140 [Paenibacillus sp. P22]